MTIELKVLELSVKHQTLTTRLTMMNLEDVARLNKGLQPAYGRKCFEELIEEQEDLLKEIQEAQRVVQQPKDGWITTGWVDSIPKALNDDSIVRYKLRNGNEWCSIADTLNWGECGYATIVGYKVVGN